ncbi:LysR family transcriptional regulator [Dactylosporangium sp. CA-233914]|uniref:LysR family transcriptional regulator n=1 Tax=Dactylosporangium sp. CA-233914 TaxID=3239934 RepID=UPI003D8B9226
MELRQLRYFATVAETCHFGRAAERLHLAQPALSHAIRQLESDLGTALFNRTTRHVALTPAGEFLYEQSRTILAAVDTAVAGVRRVATGLGGLLRLGLVGTAATSHLPRMVRVIKRELPDVAVEIHADMLTPAQCDRLREGTLDLGLLRPPATGEGIAIRTIDTEPLILAVPRDHHLAAQPRIKLVDLRTEPFVLYGNRDSAVNDAVLQSCRAAGFVPHREHEAPSTSVLLALVAAGLGIGLVPEAARSLALDGVVHREVIDAGHIELALAWAEDSEPPVAAAVRDVLLSQLDTDQLAASLPAGGAA